MGAGMRFTVEQVFLTDARGQRVEEPPRYHLVEADTVEEAISDFLNNSSASLIGTIQKYPGFQAVATARAEEAVFTMHLLPGSDTFHLRVR